MNDERDRTQSTPRRHRLAWSTALAVVVVALGAPLAGAAGVQLPSPPQAPQVPQLPLQPSLPDVPEINPAPAVPDATTLPVPVEELDGTVDPVVDGVTDAVDEATGGDAGDAVDEVVEDTGDTVGGVVDEVAGGGGPADEVVDDVVDVVTGGGGPVDEVVDDVVDVVDDPEGPVGGVVDEVTDPDGPVGGVVDEVTDPDGPVGGTIGGVLDGVGSVTDKVDGVVDGVVGALPDAPDLPGTDLPGTGGADGDPADTGGGRFAPDGTVDTATLGERIAATVPADGFAAGTLAMAGARTDDVFSGPARDLGAPSFMERIARSAAEVAGKIAFPLLLALAVGAFVVVQNRMDRRDPKLALAAIDADEDLLGFE